MDSTASSPPRGSLPIAAWVRRHPTVLVLIGAVVIGLLLSPVFRAIEDEAPLVVLGSDRVSSAYLVWLVLAIPLCVVVLWARLSLGRRLTAAVVRVLGDEEQPIRRAGAAAPVDSPTLGAAIVRGSLDLTLLLLVQSILRRPLVEVAGAFAPKEWVDGAFVVLVVLVALLILFGLRRSGGPLTTYLVQEGLDRLVPTAGYVGQATSSGPSSRASRGPVGGKAGPSRGEPAVAAPSAVAATLPAEATLPATGSSATVLAAASAVDATALAGGTPFAGATRIGPASVAVRRESGPSEAEATVLSGAPGPGLDATRVAADVGSEDGADPQIAGNPRPMASDVTVVVDEPTLVASKQSTPESTRASPVGSADATFVAAEPETQPSGPQFPPSAARREVERRPGPGPVERGPDPDATQPGA